MDEATCPQAIPQEAIEVGPDAPDGSFVYFLVRDRACVYVGRTSRLKSRIAEHRSSKDFDAAYAIPVDPERLLEVERDWIDGLSPEYNGGSEKRGPKPIHGEPMVPLRVTVTRAQLDALEATGNRSAAVRDALDLWMASTRKHTPQPKKSGGGARG